MKKNKTKSSFTVGALAVGAISITTLQAGATPIAINDPGFESSTINNYPAVGWDGGFTGSDVIIGSNNYLSTSVGNGASGSNFLSLVPNYGVTHGGQTTSYNITSANAGQTLTLSVAIGSFLNLDGTAYPATASAYFGDVELEIGGELVAANDATDTPTPIPGGFTELTMSYTIQPTDVGDIRIQFEAPTDADPANNGIDLPDRRYFDNVSLDISAASVPEPSQWALLLGGIAALFGFQRLRRKA